MMPPPQALVAVVKDGKLPRRDRPLAFGKFQQSPIRPRRTSTF